MSKKKVAWNAQKTKSVVLAKLKEFSVTKDMFCGWDIPYTVRGWFNRENCFVFGGFETEENAQAFLEKIHAMY